MTFYSTAPLRLATLAVTLGLLASYPTAVFAYAGATPPRRTGAPNELTCHQVGCHNTFDLDSGGGEFTIIPPESYVPGETHLIVVQLAHMGQMRWGFELTILDANNERVGELIDMDTDTKILMLVVPGIDREYIVHKGTKRGLLDGNTWDFEWAAPEVDAGPVTLYAAGNAASNDATPFGDYIYTTSTTIMAPEPAAPIQGAAVLMALAMLRSRLSRGRREIRPGA